MLRASVFLLLLLAVACKPKPQPRVAIPVKDTTAVVVKKLTYKPVEVIGNWHSHRPWNNREVTLKVRSDSTMVFIGKVMEKGDTTYFVAIGDWEVIADTILNMKLITDGRKYEPKNLFPELYANGATPKLFNAPITASYIIGDKHLYNITKNARDTTQYFDQMK
ncbi:MAG: hypothetical protein MUC87_03215 [Bacteroidia bacterium]|jgi:hypothetical protein|nr:hypothetical protein [Bacteroidia bacterium]